MPPCDECEHLEQCREIVGGGRVLCEIDTPTQPQNVCCDCPAEISRGATRCRACSAKHRYRNNGTKKQTSMVCIVCGAALKGFGVRCKRHASQHAYAERMRIKEIENA